MILQPASRTINYRSINVSAVSLPLLPSSDIVAKVVEWSSFTPWRVQRRHYSRRQPEAGLLLCLLQARSAIWQRILMPGVIKKLHKPFSISPGGKWRKKLCWLLRLHDNASSSQGIFQILFTWNNRTSKETQFFWSKYCEIKCKIRAPHKALLGLKHS